MLRTHRVALIIQSYTILSLVLSLISFAYQKCFSDVKTPRRLVNVCLVDLEADVNLLIFVFNSASLQNRAHDHMVSGQTY